MLDRAIHPRQTHPIRRTCSTGPGDPETATEDVPADVVARLQRGDVSALEQVFRVFGDRIYNTCRRITGTDADAEDATQDVFLRVLDRATDFRGESRFSTWLFRIAINHTLNVCRARSRRRHDPLDDPDKLDDRTAPSSHGPRPLDSVLHEEELQHLDAALQQLPPDQRAIVTLRELEEMTYTEISEVLDIPVGTVNSRLVRGRERLAELLRQSLPDHLPKQEKT